MDINEKMQRALSLKQGAVVRAVASCDGPQKLTCGREYTLEASPVGIYRNEESGAITRTPEEGSILCNVLYRITDNNGRLVEVPQIEFE